MVDIITFEKGNETEAKKAELGFLHDQMQCQIRAEKTHQRL